jgi:hypothetical protein
MVSQDSTAVVERSDTTPAGPPAPPRVRRLPTTHRPGGVSPGQVLVWQLAILAVWLAPAGPVRYAAAGAAALAMVATLGRGRRGWWYQQAGRWLRYRRPADPPAPAPLAAPEGDPDAATLAWDGAAWVAVLALRIDAPLLAIGAVDRVLDLDTLAGLLGGGVAGVRLVVRGHGGGLDGIAEPRLDGAPPVPAPAGPPGRCRAWLALRGPTGLAGAEFDGAVLRRRAARASRLLSGRGLVATVLDGPGLRLAMAEAAGPGSAEPVARWAACQRGDVAEVCYRLDRPLPPADRGSGAGTVRELHRRLAGVPADAVTVALTLTAPGGADAGPGLEPRVPVEVAARVDVRLSIAPAGVPAAVRQARVALERAIREWRPVPRDGEHAVALADTLPFGGRDGEPDRPAHAVPVACRGALDISLPGGGLFAGYASADATVSVNLAGSEPAQRLGVLADLPVAQLLAFRVLRDGAAVVVRTARPAAWGTLADQLPAGRFAVVGPADPVVAHPIRPTVVVRDDPWVGGPSAFEAVAAKPDAHPVIDVLPALTARTLAALRTYDLLVLSRTTEIDALHRAYDVPADEGRWLARLPPDVLALAGRRGRVTYARVYRAGAASPDQPQSARM